MHKLIGQRFDRLLVESGAGMNRWSQRLFNCKCDCGNVVIVKMGCLKNRYTSSCGCKRKEIAAANGRSKAKHNKTGGKEYYTWRSMKSRCVNPKNASYARYGGRGIRVCDRWMRFENFYEDMGDAPEGLTLERSNVNGDYCPENCKWATYTEQARNRSNNRILTHLGETKCVAAWAEELGISLATIYGRLHKGEVAEALFPPHQGVKVHDLYR